ncbi:MAG: F0F1 ATP synthase subunit epsilon [Muribaculaceae bacterium]|nr:F0F1 ATP synthase subunit epsilon [Muribaculaceae bacterium]
MTLEIISAQEVVYRGEADLVNLPGEMGSFTVLKNHASLISVLVPGKIRYKREGGAGDEIEIKGGLADVDNNVISVCIY